MKEEKIRDLLYGKDSDVSLVTISNWVKHGLMPSRITESTIHRWKHTFIGDLLYHYPCKRGLINQITEALGKQPTLSDFTEANLTKIVEYLKETMSPNAARQRASEIKASIARLEESDECYERIPCKRYAKILSLEGCPTTKTYLNLEDLKKFLDYEPTNKHEKDCKALFAIMLMTGARFSDVLRFKRTNVQDGILTYVPHKTKASGTVVTIPVSDTVVKFIEHVETLNGKYRNYQFNERIKALCEKCGINDEVTYFWAGKYVTKPKSQAMRSHLGRASFVTNMLKLGQRIQDVSKMAGHTDIVMTSRYNAATEVELTKEANDFINMKF